MRLVWHGYAEFKKIHHGVLVEAEIKQFLQVHYERFFPYPLQRRPPLAMSSPHEQPKNQKYTLFQRGNQLQPNIPIPLHMMKLHPMSVPPLFISLERFMLQMLGHKFKRIPVIKTGIALTNLSYPFSKLNFPILQGNASCSTKKSISDSTSHFFLHIVKDLHPKVVRPSDNLPRQSMLKNLVKCYH